MIQFLLPIIQDIIGQPPHTSGADSPYDTNGCCVSCGYTWCPDLNTCVRIWETYCKSLEEGH